MMVGAPGVATVMATAEVRAEVARVEAAMAVARVEVMVWVMVAGTVIVRVEART